MLSSVSHTLTNAAAADQAAASLELDKPKPAAFENGRVYRITGWRYWLMFLPAAFAVRLYYKTLRFKVRTEEADALEDQSEPVVVITWHNRSLMAPQWIRRYRKPSRTACLISPSRLAAWEAAFFEWLNFITVRGSSTRRSIQATRELLRAHRRGHDIGLTPDGPSGPLYSCARGALMMARCSGSPLLLTMANAKRAWRPKTWDRHLIPLPFSTVEIRARKLPPISDMGFKNDEEAGEWLRMQMLELTDDPSSLEE